MFEVTVEKLFKGELGDFFERESVGGWVNYKVHLFGRRLIISLRERSAD